MSAKVTLVEELRNRIVETYGGHGTVLESPDDLCVRAADEIERLEAECFKLSAGVCEYRGGNEHGNPLCLKTNQLI